MKVQVIKQIALEKRVLNPGEIIDVPESILSKLGGRVSPLSSSAAKVGRDLPHYCQAGEFWCSEKLPGRDHPNGCVRIRCEHHQGKQS